MATLLLTAVGTLVGGPLGGAVGALAGRSIDGAIAGSGTREGPRLKELSVTTSSYGARIAQHFGRMRAAGTIIWATDLAEHKDTAGGGKGKPKTVSYSYSISFAVALASRPIKGVGRIWADGNLLRGAAGDLKVGGTLRVYTGHGDQDPDPLIASAQGACPAFRHRAYVVFEDLALADYGNRIPALTFEIVADDGTIALAELIAQPGIEAESGMAFDRLAGFSNEGGSVLDTLDTLASVYPLACDAGGAVLSIEAADTVDREPVMLPEAASAWEDGDFGAADGQNRQRAPEDDTRPDALRYYDVGRDFQPGVQHAGGRARPGRTRTIEFPGALAADDARALASAAAQRAAWRRETLAWRLAELDPAVAPGRLVRAPGTAGTWRVAGWEWRERGVELELVRQPPVAAAVPLGDSGQPWTPPDLAPAATILRAFELPWDGYGSSEWPGLFAALSADGPSWSGAALYVDRGGELIPLGSNGRARSTLGALAAPLPASGALLFEPAAMLELDLAASDMTLASAGIAAIAGGANRLLVGGEVLQFAQAEQLSDRRWRVSGLLRGRGGTEAQAQAGHPAGASAVLIDDTLVALDPALVPASGTTTLAAIGKAEDEPVTATLTASGIGRKPLCPVHPRVRRPASGELALSWTRRARGAWDWPNEVDAPLVEQSEAYVVGCGPVDAPVAQYSVSAPSLLLRPADHALLASDQPGAAVWVRQVGNYGQSDPLLLTVL
ncbi:MAG: GTA baseplate fiber-binding domain-containing protein [Tsuneonella sp.]